MQTIGWLLDTLIVNELKIFHNKELYDQEKDAKKGKEIKSKINTLEDQRKFLIDELNTLYDDLQSRKRPYRVFRQMKRYRNLE